MKKAILLFGGIFLLACCTLASAQISQGDTITKVLDQNVSSVEGELVPLVEAMPEDKFSFVPTGGEFKGVRTFASQAKHIAAVNYMVAAAILGEKAPVDLGGENGPDSVVSKTDIVKFLKESFAYTHKAMLTISDKGAFEKVKSPFGDDKVTKISMATLIPGHCFDHYGQMVVYLRLNGIVPPASR
jgi:DinB superfamily